MSSKKFVDARKKIFGDRLRSIRQSLGIAQNIFAEQLNSSAGYISEIESGKSTPGIDLMEALKNIYHVDINWLLTGIGGMFVEETSVDIKNNQNYIIKDNESVYRTRRRSAEVQTILNAVEEIMTSDDETTKTALKMNVIAFHQAVKNNKKIVRLEEDVGEMKKKLNNVLKQPAPNTGSKGM